MSEGPEGRIDRTREKRQGLSATMRTAYEKARSELSEYSLQESDFVPVYGKAKIIADLKEVKRLRDTWERDAKPEDRISNAIASIFEAIVLTQSELSEWLGTARTIRTTSYDDYKHGVDMLATWDMPEGGQTLALAVDVTFGKRTAEKKLIRERENIRRGELGKISYYSDEGQTFMGMRVNVPRVVIGISQAQVEELARLWVNTDKKALGAHAVQRVLVEEIHSQLRAMKEYAEAIGNSQIAAAYAAPLKIVSGLLSEKRTLQYNGLDTDPVFLEILEQTALIFGKKV